MPARPVRASAPRRLARIAGSPSPAAESADIWRAPARSLDCLASGRCLADELDRGVVREQLDEPGAPPVLDGGDRTCAQRAVPDRGTRHGRETVPLAHPTSRRLPGSDAPACQRTPPASIGHHPSVLTKRVDNTTGARSTTWRSAPIPDVVAAASQCVRIDHDESSRHQPLLDVPGARGSAAVAAHCC